MRLRPIVLAAALALVAVACGADDPPTVAEPATTEPTVAEAAGETGAAATDEAVAEGSVDGSAAPAPAVAGPGDVPDLQMINVHTGTTLDLQSVVDGQTPLLFWFWAPH